MIVSSIDVQPTARDGNIAWAWLSLQAQDCSMTVRADLTEEDALTIARDLVRVARNRLDIDSKNYAILNDTMIVLTELLK